MDSENTFQLKKRVTILLMYLIYLFLLIYTVTSKEQISLWQIVLMVLFPLIMVAFTYGISLLREKNLAAVNMELQALTDNLSAGVLRCSIDDPFSIQYASASALKLLGYTKEEMFEQLGHNLASIIPAADVRGISEEYIKDRGNGKKDFSFEFRIRHKSGKELWVSEHIKIADSHDGGNLFAFLMDITAAKEAEKEKQIRDECYRIIYETSEESIFDYDIEKKEIISSGSFVRKFGWKFPDGVYPQTAEQFIHLDDLQKFNKMFTRASTSDEKRASGEIRVVNRKGSYLWCTVEMFGVVDERQCAARIIGKIIDVDTIKREKMELLETSIRDPMTGILNKAATKDAIETLIREYDGKRIHAFLIMDIDDFKRVNDRFGHMEGDRVIKVVASLAKETFRETDITGRIGGDEFVCFLKDIDSWEIVKERVQILFENLNKVMIGGEYPVSVSVGIAMFPTDATDHDGLYHCADLALYRSKHVGKNTFEPYTGHLEHGAK